jgi:hypothetical protein
MKKKFYCFLIVVCALLFSIVAFSACDSVNAEKTQELTSVIMQNKYSGKHSEGSERADYYYKTNYTFKFISETQVTIEREYTATYSSYAQSRGLRNQHEIKTETVNWSLKVYNSGKAYIYIQDFDSAEKDTSNNEESSEIIFTSNGTPNAFTYKGATCYKS